MTPPKNRPCLNDYMADQLPPRRRFQFRLRSLMIMVTLLAVPCAYVGWQVRLVRERRDILDNRTKHATAIYGMVDPPSLTLGVRRWLGDVAVRQFFFNADATDDEIEVTRRALPEAEVWRGEQRSSGRVSDGRRAGF
jgi:hypothetical protein